MSLYGEGLVAKSEAEAALAPYVIACLKGAAGALAIRKLADLLPKDKKQIPKAVAKKALAIGAAFGCLREVEKLLIEEYFYEPTTRSNAYTDPTSSKKG